MFEYSITVWFAFFIIYSFLGWIWEVIYESTRARRLINRGFLNGPLIPIYGFGSLICLVIYDLVSHNTLATVVSFMVIGTTMELATGLAMERIFKVRYWDYSEFKGNFKGYICPQASLFWALLSFLLITFIHPRIAQFVTGIPSSTLVTVTYVAIIYFIGDLTVSIFDGIHLRQLLREISRRSLELRKLRNVELTLFSNIVPERQELLEKYQGHLSNLENQLGRLTKSSKDYYSEMVKAIENVGIFTPKHHRVVNMLRRNPTAVSKTYPIVLRQIQKLLKSRK